VVLAVHTEAAVATVDVQVDGGPVALDRHGPRMPAPRIRVRPEWGEGGDGDVADQVHVGEKAGGRGEAEPVGGRLRLGCGEREDALEPLPGVEVEVDG
jgi:hypothetical protein